MPVLENLTELAKRINEKTPEKDVFSTYERMAETIPQGTLADALVNTFRNEKTMPFREAFFNLFHEASPVQKAAILNKISGTLGSGRLAEILGARARFGVLAKILSGGAEITPAQAEEIRPDDVKAFVEEAEKKEPKIVNAASTFFAQHPLLVKALGARTLVRLISRIAEEKALA